MKNIGNGETRSGWFDEVVLSDMPTLNAPSAKQWSLGTFKNLKPLRPVESYTNTQTVLLNPAAKGQYLIVRSSLSDATPNNNVGTAATDVTRVIPDLQVTDVATAASALSGEMTTITYTVTNISADPIWDGTSYWTDEIWLSKDPTFIPHRATIIGDVSRSNATPLAAGDSYTHSFDATLPTGIQGDHFVYVFANVQNRGQPTRFNWPIESGGNNTFVSFFSKRAYEDPTNNMRQAPLLVILNEPDLRVTNVQLPATITSGQTIDVLVTVTNTGARATRTSAWSDGLYLSTDPSLDNADYLLRDETNPARIVDAYRRHVGALAPNASYDVPFRVAVPYGIAGDFHFLAFTDSSTTRSGYVAANFGIGLTGVGGGGTGAVQEFQGEGNNITAVARAILPATPPDLRVTRIDVPARAVRGQRFDVTYEVLNDSNGDTAPLQDRWDDLIYLSRDQFLDLRADRFLGSVRHTGGLVGNGTYENTLSINVPTDLIGTWYVFAVTDPARYNAQGNVFEGPNERNNDLVSSPIVFELPPPTDLQVTDVTVPASVRSG